MEKSELKNMDAASLSKEVASLQKELFNLKLNMLTGQVKDVSQFKKIRSRIARTLTYLNDKKNK